MHASIRSVIDDITKKISNYFDILQEDRKIKRWDALPYVEFYHIYM